MPAIIRDSSIAANIANSSSFSCKSIASIASITSIASIASMASNLIKHCAKRSTVLLSNVTSLSFCTVPNGQQCFSGYALILEPNEAMCIENLLSNG
jgi:hypothetical protein